MAAGEAAGETTPARPANLLAREKSPYLLLHKDDPIGWRPWGDEAFAVARAQNKPIFLSIGYSACHWCHVMGGESFANAEVAAVLNDGFVAVLVDREERPDVDRFYGEALEAMIGSSGWPMTMLLTPDGSPFTGATFIPRPLLLRLLRQVRTMWREEPERIEVIGRKVTAVLKEEAAAGFSGAKPPGAAALRRYYAAVAAEYDPATGGFGLTSRFPHPMQLSMLLRIHRRTGEARPLRMVETTLRAMARGGVHDHLGGGFHRYTVDRHWRIPHFEKMLPDNALLAVALLEAYQATGNGEYSLVARGILDYLLRDMRHPEGAFFAAEDSDSEKTEGKFYVWTIAQVRAALSPAEFQVFSATYPLSEEGNFSPTLKNVEENAGLKAARQGNIIHLPADSPLPTGKNATLAAARQTLLRVRSRRVRPLRDEKVVTGWNGLAIAALAKGFQVLEERKYLRAAQRAAQFLLRHSRTDDGALYRRWRDGEAKIDGFLTDYALLVHGLLELYQSDFDRQWLDAALALQETQHRFFWDEPSGSYRFSRAPVSALLAASRPFTDRDVPSGNSVAALNLLRIADLTLNWQLKKRAARILSAGATSLRRAPVAHPFFLAALDYLLDKSKEIAVIGPP
ncbi:MAG: thioredoxin domain-containing protein, partial [bacterium]